jgi:hypothetical protein
MNSKRRIQTEGLKSDSAHFDNHAYYGHFILELTLLSCAKHIWLVRICWVDVKVHLEIECNKTLQEKIYSMMIITIKQTFEIMLYS